MLNKPRGKSQVNLMDGEWKSNSHTGSIMEMHKIPEGGSVWYQQWPLVPARSTKKLRVNPRPLVSNGFAAQLQPLDAERALGNKSSSWRK